MTSNKKDPVLVVLQLSGGNDYMNTVIPYNDPIYRDSRPVVAIPENDILALNGEIGLHPSMSPIRDLYQQGNVAIVHGVGYPIRPAPISALWTSGIPASRTRWGPRVGWDWPPGT